jgi:tight adherence protein C
MSPFFISVTIFLLLAIAGTAAWTAIFGRHRNLEERFENMTLKMKVAYGGLLPHEAEQEGVARAMFLWAVERLPAPKLDTPEGRKLANILVQAGYPGSSAMRTFQLIRLGSAIAGTAGAVVFAIALHASGLRPALMMFSGAGIGGWLPYFIVARRAHNRQQEIASQLSDVLDLLVVCVEAGLGINEAIKVVASETERQGQEIGRELAMVSAEISAGSTLGNALRGLADRVAVEDIKPLAATMIQSEQLGAQMGPALRSISDGLRNARRLRAEEAAQKTTVKILFPLVFFVLPAMMAVIVGPAMIEIMRTLHQ